MALRSKTANNQNQNQPQSFITGGRWCWLVLQSPKTEFLRLDPPELTRTTTTQHTTSQPQKDACQQNSTAPVGPSWRRLAVVPIPPPAGWGTRSTRSHLGKRPEHEIPDFC
jgi:hypothetical protein